MDEQQKYKKKKYVRVCRAVIFWAKEKKKKKVCLCVCVAVLAVALLAICGVFSQGASKTTEDACRVDQGLIHWMPPVQCPQGRQHWSKEQLLEAVPEFLEVYGRRPHKVNIAGMNINHAFALWFTIKQVKPKYLIENGVWRGQSTYIMREAAGPDAFLYSIDPCGPLDDGYRRGLRDSGNGYGTYEDPNPRSQRFMGLDFRDFGEINWKRYVPEDELEKVFVMFDDHVDHSARLRQMKAIGFKHAWFDDNSNWQMKDCYSMNQICSDIPDVAGALEHYTFVLSFRANACPDYNQISYNMTRSEHLANLDWVRRNVEIYFEIPPLHDGCGWDVPNQLLSSDDLIRFGLQTRDEEQYHYAHQHTPYVKLFSKE